MYICWIFFRVRTHGSGVKMVLNSWYGMYLVFAKSPTEYFFFGGGGGNGPHGIINLWAIMAGEFLCV
jgi:hypothetical protein